MSPLRLLTVVLLLALPLTARAETALFFGNSFTYAATVHPLEKAGGVPKLVEAIATAKGKTLTTDKVTVGGKTWDFLLALPSTDKALSQTWDWVILQDHSNRATEWGSPADFMRDGNAFSDRIAKNSPKAGIILYETWPRPVEGGWYKNAKDAKTPGAMMAEIHDNYAKLAADLAKKNPDRPVRVAPVGTAWMKPMAENPGLDLWAADHHHANANGYYLAALVIYETIYHDTVKGAPSTFFDNTVVIPNEMAANLQKVADEVCASPEPAAKQPAQ